MLILSRRINEDLRIGHNVRITVLGLKGNQVRIGIDAPKSVSVHREEIYQRIKEEEKSKQEEVVDNLQSETNPSVPG